MAKQIQDNITPPDLHSSSTTPQTSSTTTTTPDYYGNVLPLNPLKEEKYWEVSCQRSLDDSFGVLKRNIMPSSGGFYACQQDINSFRRDSLLDPPFYYNFDPKAEDNISLLVDFDHGSTEALLDSYCSSNSSRSTTSPHQSLLPPLPQHLSSSTKFLVSGEGVCPYQQRPLPATPPEEESMQKTAFNTPAKRSFNPLQLESLRQSSRSPTQGFRSQTLSPTARRSPSHTRSVVPLSSPASTTTTSSSLHSAMSSSDTTSLLTTHGSSSSVPKRNGSAMRKPSKRLKPAKMVQQDGFPCTSHGLTISSPLETKSSSPVVADFNFTLPSHDLRIRRRHPSPPNPDGIVSTPVLASSCSTSLGSPTTPSSIKPLLPPFHEQSLEISAFDSDTDDEGPSQAGRRVHYKASFARLGTSRSRAETVPAANPRTISKGAALSKRISKQDIRTPGLRSSNASDNTAAGSGITTVDTSDSLTPSRVVPKTSRAAIPPTTLRKKMLTQQLSPSRSKRASDESHSSKRSGTSSNKQTASFATTSGSTAQGERNGSTSSAKKLRNWIARVFGRRNTH